MIIISAELKALPYIDNIMRTNRLRKLLSDSGYTFKDALGRFDGVNETSFVVNSNDVDALRSIALTFDQQCVMYVDDLDRKAYLVKSMETGDAAFVGVFQNVERDEAQRSIGFTYVNDAYFVVK